MKIVISQTNKELGANAAKFIADKLRQIIAKKGGARIVVSTGASQLETLNALIKEGVEWNKIEMFHLDEYMELPETHPASFRKYLKERLIANVNFKATYLVDGTEEGIAELTAEIRKTPIDLGIIGIGENAHIAFNDPPADFDSKAAYHIVNLDAACKAQQVREGWFPTTEDVPKKAVSMTVYQIMQCKTIVSCVPYAVKAQAIKDMLESNSVTNLIPATILKTHDNYFLFLDRESASLADIKGIDPLDKKDEFSLNYL